MTVMNPYNYSKPRSFIRVAPEKKEADFQNEDDVTAVSNNTNDRSQQYLENKVMSAKPEELTYMLYEGLVKFIKKAMMYLPDKKMAEVNYNTQRAQAIVDELRATLNHDVRMSANLDALYEYLSFKLVEANIKKNEAKFKEALEIAEEFKETWREAFDLKN